MLACLPACCLLLLHAACLPACLCPLACLCLLACLPACACLAFAWDKRAAQRSNSSSGGGGNISSSSSSNSSSGNIAACNSGGGGSSSSNNGGCNFISSSNSSNNSYNNIRNTCNDKQQHANRAKRFVFAGMREIRREAPQHSGTGTECGRSTRCAGNPAVEWGEAPGSGRPTAAKR